jgi:hypothetical protein
LEHWDKKFAVAGAATEGFFSRRWVAEHLFSMSDEEFLRNQRELFYDRKFDAQLAATAEAMAEEAAGLGGGGGMGGDELGGDELGGEDLGGEELGGEDLGGEAEAGGEEDVLLAAPGRREDEPSSISKGKAYYPVKPHRDRRPAGAYSRHLSAKAGANVGDSRKITPGFKGIGGLGELSKGMFEQQQSNYSEQDLLEESRIHSLSHEVASLIKNLENSELKKDEIQT